MRRFKVLVLFFAVTVLAAACGGNSQNPDNSESAATVPVSVKKKQKATIPIHTQMQTLAANEDTFIREDVRTVGDGEGVSVEGPFYSLMDLDQDGYLEMVVYDETGVDCPVFYEVTADGTLQKWTTEGDVPQEHEFYSIFDTTSKADCYYDSSKDQYHYIVWDKISLSQDDADVNYLDMMPDDTGVTFRKIGRYTFDASMDGKYHYYDAEGKECEESDITAVYADMTKKTMYYKSRTISKKEAGEVYWFDMENTIWENFLLRDDYRGEKEKELTDEIRHQFFSLTLDLEESAAILTEGDGDDEIRYAAADLDHDQNVEIIVENLTKHTYRICSGDEEFRDEDTGDEDTGDVDIGDEDTVDEGSEDEGNVWKTEWKSLSEVTDQADHLIWYSCTYSKFFKQSRDLWEDNLRESWLQFPST